MNFRVKTLKELEGEEEVLRHVLCGFPCSLCKHSSMWVLVEISTIVKALNSMHLLKRQFYIVMCPSSASYQLMYLNEMIWLVGASISSFWCSIKYKIGLKHLAYLLEYKLFTDLLRLYLMRLVTWFCSSNTYFLLLLLILCGFQVVKSEATLHSSPKHRYIHLGHRIHSNRSPRPSFCRCDLISEVESTSLWSNWQASQPQAASVLELLVCRNQ